MWMDRNAKPLTQPHSSQQGGDGPLAATAVLTVLQCNAARRTDPMRDAVLAREFLFDGPQSRLHVRVDVQEGVRLVLHVPRSEGQVRFAVLQADRQTDRQVGG
eukprot:GHVU01081937.1.p4 GENE.GHVU01081937.1~~GHVU01081937.1.p4  ORF type:complete len:103 (+),score=8.32 GHVU01081937.1:1079-1387(+)